TNNFLFVDVFVCLVFKEQFDATTFIAYHISKVVVNNFFYFLLKKFNSFFDNFYILSPLVTIVNHKSYLKG
ncbi:hypothetical protein, partial [Neobacillus sp.]|uniref:hypothetical protein n=1 Tax=Neobacillus sp. TaxID=2675273 RepID=UPI00289E6291